METSAFSWVRDEENRFKHRFKAPQIERIEADCFRIADGQETKWFARQFNDEWHVAHTLGELFANRILRQAA